VVASWDLRVSGCDRVLRSTVSKVLGFDGDVAGVEEVFGAAMDSLRHGPLVAITVGEVVPRVVDPQVRLVVGHSDAAVRGTVDAVQSYIAGDEEMAARAQRHASLATYPSDTPGLAPGLAR
jgi:hypothetical protein